MNHTGHKRYKPGRGRGSFHDVHGRYRPVPVTQLYRFRSWVWPKDELNEKRRRRRSRMEVIAMTFLAVHHDTTTTTLPNPVV